MNCPVQVRKREHQIKFGSWLSPVFAVLLTLLASFLIFLMLGINPFYGLYVFCVEPLLTLRGWGELGVKMTPLILCALGLVVCYRANIWNIGAEGQLIIGALCGGTVALLADYESPGLFVILVLTVGALGGALYAWIVAWLKNKFNANEILTSLMLVYVAQLFLSWAVQSPLRDPAGLGFPQSAMFESSAMLPVIIPGTRMHAGLFLVVIATFCVWLLMTKMFLGFQYKVAGVAPKAAAYAGFSSSTMIYSAMLLSGALAGLAGVVEVTGPIGQLTPTISPGYGFAAIIVAFVGRLRPLGTIPAAFVMALFYLGGELAQSRLGTPSAMTGVFQGLLLFFILACDSLLIYRLHWIGFNSNKGAAA